MGREKEKKSGADEGKKKTLTGYKERSIDANTPRRVRVLRFHCAELLLEVQYLHVPLDASPQTQRETLWNSSWIPASDHLSTWSKAPSAPSDTCDRLSTGSTGVLLWGETVATPAFFGVKNDVAGGHCGPAIRFG